MKIKIGVFHNDDINLASVRLRSFYLFDYILDQLAYPKLDADIAADQDLVNAFESHKIHDVMKVCAELRPSVDISFQD